MLLMYGNSVVLKGVSISCWVVWLKIFKFIFDLKLVRYLLMLVCVMLSIVVVWLIFSLVVIIEIIFNFWYLSCNFVIVIV